MIHSFIFWFIFLFYLFICLFILGGFAKSKQKRPKSTPKKVKLENFRQQHLWKELMNHLKVELIFFPASVWMAFFGTFQWNDASINFFGFSLASCQSLCSTLLVTITFGFFLQISLKNQKYIFFRSAIWILWDHCTNLNWSQNGKYEVHYENFPMIFFIYIFHNRCEILEINNLHWWRFLFFNDLFKEIICGALRDLVPFVPFEKRKKHLWRCITFTKVAGFSHFVKINTPPWVFFKLFKTYKWYLIAQNVSYFW